MEKKKLLIINPIFFALLVTSFASFSCSSAKKGFKVNINYFNCDVSDQAQYIKEYQENEEVVLKAKSKTTYTLPNDVDVIMGGIKLVNGKDYTYSKETGELRFNIKGDTDITINAEKGTLNDYSWREIKDISINDKANECFNVGDTKEILVNNIIQKVRIIGINQDVNKDGRKIGITFEFENLLSDENGYSLATYWKNTDIVSSANHNYMDSTIRAVLNGEGRAAINWFQFFGEDKDYEDEKRTVVGKNGHFSSSYDGKTVLDMLPIDLVNVLSTPSKFINIFNYSLNDYVQTTVNDKLFILSPREMGYQVDYAMQEPSTFTYEYYRGHEEYGDDIRIKYQIKRHDGARSFPFVDKKIDGSFNSATKSIFAGQNYASEGMGSDYWLRSPYNKLSAPYTNPGECAWSADAFGNVDGFYINTFSNAYPISPCFCV